MTNHNVVFLGARVVNFIFGGYQGASFHETSEKTDTVGIVACFRNEAVYGKKIESVRSARAQLKFFDAQGTEIGTGFSRAFWLGEKIDLVDFDPGGPGRCVIAIVSSPDKTTIPYKRRIPTGWGDTLKDEFLDLEKFPHTVEISILDASNQLALLPIRIELSSPRRGQLSVAMVSTPAAKHADALSDSQSDHSEDVAPAEVAAEAEVVLRSESAEKSWTRDQRIGLGLLFLAVLTVIVAVVTPEIRRKIGLEKDRGTSLSSEPSTPGRVDSPATNFKQDSKPSSNPQKQNPESTIPAGATKEENKAVDKVQVHVQHHAPKDEVKAEVNRRVPGKSVSPNVTVNNAPNGIAISGGTVSNPTVINNVPPSRGIPADLRANINWLLARHKALVRVLVVSGDKEANDFAWQLYNLLEDAGWEMKDKQVIQVVLEGKPWTGVRVGYRGQPPPDPNGSVDVQGGTPQGALVGALKAAKISAISVNPKADLDEGLIELLVSSNPAQ